MADTINESAIKKLEIVVTVVDRAKADFYLDILSQFEVNFQVVISGKGTARSEIIEMLGLNINKAVIVSVVREDMVSPIIRCLEEKFETIRNGKGIAISIPMSGIIGVNMYQFLSNNKQGREE